MFYPNVNQNKKKVYFALSKNLSEVVFKWGFYLRLQSKDIGFEYESFRIKTNQVI